MKEKIRKFFKEPLVAFFVLGFVVFGLHSLLNRARQEDKDPFTVEVTSSDIEWIKSSFEARMKRQPTQKEFQALIDHFIRDEILHREALAMDLDDRDLIIQRRLVQKLTFVFEDLAETLEPTDDELKKYLEQNRDKYKTPAMISFTQVYFSPEKRETALDDANAALAGLKAEDSPPEAAATLGDATMLAASFRQKTAVEVARALGQAFADKLFATDEKGWQGPIASTFGWHVVYVSERRASKTPEFSSLRDEVKADFMYLRKKEVVDTAYSAAKSRYTVLVEGLPLE
jgi:hypothetical protein